jgi:hypothetical protein
MTLQPGTGAAYAGSLGEAIEAAFAGELYALRATALPETGAEDRRVLFSAIAQGVLQYLSRHRLDLVVELPDPDPPTNVRLDVPILSATLAQVAGSGWGASPVKLTLLRTGQQQTVTPSLIDQTFSTGFVARETGDVVDARDAGGRAAQAVVG